MYFSSFMNQRKGGRGERNSQFGKAFPENSPIIARTLDSTHTHIHIHTFLTLSLTGQVFTFSIHQRQKARRNRGRGGRGREKKRGIPGKRVKDGIGEKQKGGKYGATVFPRSSDRARETFDGVHSRCKNIYVYVYILKTRISKRVNPPIFMYKI